jgi:UDP-glucuronate 4-epimerase
MKILVTGGAGMIGFHAAKHFKQKGWDVIGLDNYNDYYDVGLKEARSNILKDEYAVDTIKGDILDFEDIFNTYTWVQGVDVVLHLAAYANPRHSLEEPQCYIDTNISGTQKIINVCESMGIPVVYASSSCVMHGQPLPWNEHDRPDIQNNPYGWSKRVNECQFSHSKVPRSAGLRFFTVYGPYGRPDMALFKFTKGIVEGTPLTLYNYGDMKRDFTYVDDIINGIEIVVNKVVADTDRTRYHEIYNIGYGAQVQLMDFVKEIEKNLGRESIHDLVPKHPADVPETWSDTTKLQALGYKPTTPVSVGVAKFVEWYKEYYRVN